MAQFQIRVDLSDVMSARQIITAEVFPMINQAIRAIAQQAQLDWMESVDRAKIWSGEKAAYRASIQWRMISDFEALVWSDYNLAEEIETGRPPKDLKRMLNTSLKVRVSKKGNRYMYIPFQHNVPGADATGQAMPHDIYSMARTLEASSVIGKGRRLSGTGAFGVKSKRRLTVASRQYSWGGSLPAGLAPKLKPHHATDIYAGMKRFDTSSGGAKRSTYLTFRTMSQTSNGWIVPAKPGLFLAKAVAESLQPVAEQVLQEALKRSV